MSIELGWVPMAANLEVAARRIVCCKFYNAGQTCIAPDYVLVHERVEERLLESLKATIAPQAALKPGGDGSRPRAR